MMKRIVLDGLSYLLPVPEKQPVGPDTFRKGFMYAFRFMKILQREHPTDAANRREKFTRASGDVVCPSCQLEFRDHPNDPQDEFLKVLCNLDRVKL